MDDAALLGEVREALETKSVESGILAAEELRRLLNEMMVEMHEQFSTFRRMRESAAGALSDGDEAAQKLARADVKAVTDAMSLIVRTLEKVDSLQRQLARDREIEADCLVEGATPAAWAQAVVKAYRRFAADRIVAEVNQGGEMVTAMLRSVGVVLPITMVRATRGKFTRAEPVAALSDQGRVAHAGRFIELEDQMCDFCP